jgi:uncharacterized membrane protein
VANRFCPFCGAPVVAGGAFCPACGASLTWAPAAAPATPPPPTAFVPSFAPAGSTSAGSGPSAATQQADRHALGSVQWATIVALVGVVVGLVTLFGTNAAAVLSVTRVGSTTMIYVSLSGLYFLAAVSAGSFVLTFVEAILYRGAFRTLAGIDSRFATPSTLTLVLIVALVLVVLVGAGIFVVVYQAVECAGAGNPLTSSCLSLGTALGLVGLLGVVAIVALVGFVGLLIGIWRLGTRYGESMFKVGAVLLIIPLLNFVGAVLILLAARSARERIGRPETPATFG